ncbi:MAG: hypothetical protein HY658_00165 [Actinobacteria bacterium]|nr:hypothetical protein [Actinomycetota bacterium]
MSSDLRDDRLTEAFEAAVAGIRPSPERLPEIRRRGNLRRAARWTAGAAAVAVFAGALTWAGISLRPDRGSVTAAYGGPELGWSLRYPPDWHVQPFGDEGCEIGGVRGGAFVSNVRHEFRQPDGGTGNCLSRWDLGGLPEDAAVVQAGAYPLIRGLLRPPDTELPIAFDDLRPTGGIAGGPDEYYLVVARDGEAFFMVRAYIGREASPDDVETVRQIVGSIRFDGAPVWMAHENPEHGWSFEHPDTWAVGAFTDAPGPVDCGSGQVVSNRDVEIPRVDPAAPDGCVWSWSSDGLPSDLVFVELAEGWEGETPPLLEALPLDPAGFLVAPESATGGGFAGRGAGYLVGDRFIRVVIWAGPDASDVDVALAEGIVRSIRFTGFEPPPAVDPSEPTETPTERPTGEPTTAEELGWAFENEAGWHVQPFQWQCRISRWGVFISNVEFYFTHVEPEDGGCSTDTSFTGLPLDSVVIELGRTAGGPTPVPSDRPDTEFPVSLGDLERIADGRPGFAIFRIPVWLDGFGDRYVVVTVGPNASPEDVAAMEEILASVRIAERAG